MKILKRQIIYGWMLNGMLLFAVLGAIGFFVFPTMYQLYKTIYPDTVEEIPPPQSLMPILPPITDVPVDPPKNYYPHNQDGND